MPNCIFCDQENPTGQASCQLCKAPLPDSESGSLPDAVFRGHLVQLLGENQRVQAVAAYRRRTGVDLTSAVAAIDALERDQEFNVTPAAADLEWEVIGFLERGEKIGAIRFYREKTGLDLKAAKDTVEAIELRVGLAPEPNAGAGCFGLLLLIGLCSMVGLMIRAV